MGTRRGKKGNLAAAAGAERSVAEDAAGAARGRPGRRSAEERAEAVLQLLAGKASIDQLAFRFGVQATTIEKWREVALEGVAQALRQGTGRSPQEQELGRKLATLERAFTDLAIRHELVQRAVAERPSRPGKSTR
jgi:transposase-like protein